jgi:hypothetical protein
MSQQIQKEDAVGINLAWGGQHDTYQYRKLHLTVEAWRLKKAKVQVV